MSDDITSTGSDGAAQEISLRTDDGLRLVGDLVVPASTRAAVVACHPHPLHGGNRRSLIPGELFRHLPDHGVAVLRFDFRGVADSEGEHGGGVEEVLDVEAAVVSLAEAVGEQVPLVIAGWSFGADVSLRVTDRRVAGWVPIAPPLRVVDPATMTAATDPRPKLLVIPEHDQFNPPERAREVTEAWIATDLVVVNGADHFLVGRTDRVVRHVLDLVDELT